MQRGAKRQPCPCPACHGEVYRPLRRLGHTLVDTLAGRPAGGGDLLGSLRLDIQVDTEARATWARLGQ